MNSHVPAYAEQERKGGMYGQYYIEKIPWSGK